MDAAGTATSTATARSVEVAAPAPPVQAAPETAAADIAARPWLRVIQGGSPVEPPPIDALATLASRVDTGGRVRMIDALQRTIGNKAATELLTRPGALGPADPPADPREVSDGDGRVRRLADAGHPHLTLLRTPSHGPADPVVAWHRDTPAAAAPTGESQSSRSADAQSGVPAAPPPTAQRDLADDLLKAGRSLLGRLRDRATSVVSGIRETAAAAWERAQALGSEVVDAVSSRTDAVREMLGGAWDGLQSFASSIWESLRARGAAVADQLQGAASSAGEALRGGWEALKGAAGPLIESLKARAEALFEALKARGGSLFAASIGSNGAECLTDESLGAGRSAFGPAREEALGGLEGIAAGIFGQLGELWSGLSAAGRSGLAGLRGLAGSLAGALDEAASAAIAGLQTLGTTLESQATTLVSGLRELSSSLITNLGGVASGAVDAVANRVETLVGGLQGLVGGIVSSLGGEANNIINQVRRLISGIIGDIRLKIQEVIRKIQQKANAFVDRILDMVRRVLVGVGRAIAELGRRAARIREVLRRAWEAVKRQITRLFSELLRRWNTLKSKVRAFWVRLKALLRRLAARAQAALSKTEGASCELPAAAREGQSLSDLTLGRLIGETPLFKRRGGRALDGDDPDALRASLGKGVGFDGAARTRMESAFGRDFGPVRLHTDSNAAAMADRLDARAFALGNDVAFGAGEYRPGTVIGDALLAHELAHVGQADAGTATLRDDRSEDSAVELAADRSAINAVARLWLGAKGSVEGVTAGALPAIRSGLRLRRCAKAKCCTVGEPPALDPKLFEAEHDCNPLAADRADVFALKSGTKKKTLLYGNTGFVVPPTGFQDYGRPSQVKVADKCGEHCKLDLPSPPRFVLSPFIATKAGEYPEGTRKVKKPGKHFGKVLPAFEVVTPALANRIAEAEREHCRDHKVAWRKGYGKYIAAVTSLKDGYCIPPVDEDAGPSGAKKACAEEYEKRLKERAGTSMAGADGIGQCLHPLTITERDDKKKHTIPAGRTEEVDESGTKILLTIPDKGALPDIGNPSSEDLMKGCGE